MNAEEGALQKAKETAKQVKQIGKQLSQMENRVGLVESKSTSDVQPPLNSPMVIKNATRIEELATDVAKINLRISKLANDLESRTSATGDINSTAMNNWFKTKFTALQQAPESRLYLKELMDAKLLSLQVNYLHMQVLNF